MKSEKKTDIFGNEKTVHIDDAGRVVGETVMEKDLFGNEYAVHRDAAGRETGRSYVKKSFFGDEKIEHVDAYGRVCGESREEQPLFGQKKVVHRDANGREIGTSYEKSPLFGGDYVETQGTFAGYYPKSGADGSSGGDPAKDDSGFAGGGAVGAAGGAAGAVVMIVELAIAIALYLVYCFMIRHNLQIVEIIRSLVCVGLCPLLSLLCILKNRANRDATAAQRKARNSMLTATTTLFLLLEICFLLYTDPKSEADAVLAFVLFLCCWIPKVIYSIWGGVVVRKSDIPATREACDKIFCFASKAFAATVCLMELVNVLAGETSESIFRIIIVVVPGIVILWLVISLLTVLTDKLYRKIAG